MLYPVIMAGGVGSRLWPMSRALLPKQFIEFSGAEASLFQNTVTRLTGLEELANPVIICNEEHRFLVAEQLRKLEQDSDILLEPMGRNTAPAVAMAALWALDKDPEAALLVLPADHVISDKSALHEAVRAGMKLLNKGHLVTFGIVPGAPETGFGYIERGETIVDSPASVVSRFVEKPDRETAESYLASGNYLWNSGMFLFRAADYLKELETHAPDIHAACEKAFAHLARGDDFQQIPESEFGACPSDSIDYAVMEKTDRAAVVPLDAGWNDLGAWDALWEAGARDPEGNCLFGDVLTSHTSDSYVEARSRLVATVGLSNTVVVETADAVLVADRGHAQQVKDIVSQLQAGAREEANSHTLVFRPWGSYESLAFGDGYQVKHIVVKPGAALSLQLHHKRAEHWTVIRGTALVTLDDREFKLEVNESIFIPLGSKHRLTNEGSEPVEIIEVQVGEYLGEDDIVRFDDRYGRSS